MISRQNIYLLGSQIFSFEFGILCFSKELFRVLGNRRENMQCHKFLEKEIDWMVRMKIN